MRKFRCSICGYIHTGENPPEQCPICGAPPEKFVLLDEKEVNMNNDVSLGSKKEEDIYCDLVVVGSGAAALSAACFAAAKGLDVIVAEKASEFGGTTKRSGARYWIPNNKYQEEIGIKDSKPSCLKYMVRLSYPELYDENKNNYGLDDNTFKLFEGYYDNASKAINHLEELGIMESTIDYCWKKIPYGDYQEHLENPITRGRSLLPKTDKGPLTMGEDLVEILMAYLKKQNVRMYTDYRVANLIIDDQVARGVIVVNKGKYINIHATKGVFFGTGGFSHNLELMNQFQPGKDYGGCAVPSNEGDIISIAEKNSLKIANMQNAYRVQSMLEVYLANPGGASSMFYHIGDSTLQVNKYGKRIMNEKRNYNDRSQAHFIWDANKAEHTNLLTFMIFDARTAKLWQGFPPLPVGDPTESFYIISGNTLDELSNNIQKRLISYQDKIPNFRLDEQFTHNLKETVDKFNEYAISGHDLEFNRGAYNYDQEYTTFPPTIPNVQWPDEVYPNITMYPLSNEGPYYAIILASGTLDTNGGVVINERAQVINAYNKTIRGLYAGGNCVAAFNKAAYYGAGGTIGPALTSAYVTIEDILKK